VRNIAEGAGRWSEADSSKHYKIARGEAMECAASLDVMKLRRVVAPERYEQGVGAARGGRGHADQDAVIGASKGDVHVHVAVAVNVNDKVNAAGARRLSASAFEARAPWSTMR
jgi:hypothetical protein